MKILVTGGAGYIGSTVCSALLDAGHTPIILDSLVTGRREFVKDRIFYEGDIANHVMLAKILTDHPDVKVLMHFAARIVISESVADPLLYYTENVTKSIELFGAARQLGLKNIIFSSSASVYKGNENFVVDEKSELAPLSPYARTKLATELVLEDFCNAGYFRAITLRYFNPIGADPKKRTGPFVPDPSHILGRLVSTSLGNLPEFQIMGTDWPTRDSSAMRDYIHIWDLAQAHVLAAEKFDDVFTNEDFTNKKSTWCVMNVGSGNGVTVKEFVQAFMNVLGKEIPVSNGPRRPGDVVGAYANCKKAQSLLGWQTNFSTQDGIKDALQWMRLFS